MNIKKLIASATAIVMALTMFGSMTVVNAEEDIDVTFSLNVIRDEDYSGYDVLVVELSYETSYDDLYYTPATFPNVEAAKAIVSMSTTIENDANLEPVFSESSIGKLYVSGETAEPGYYLFNAGTDLSAYIVEPSGVLATGYYFYDENIGDIEFTLGTSVLGCADASVGYAVTFRSDGQGDGLIVNEGATYVLPGTEPEGPTTGDTSIKETEWTDSKTVGVAAEVIIPSDATVSTLIYALTAVGTDDEGNDVNLSAEYPWDISELVTNVSGVTLGFALNVQQVPKGVTIDVTSVTAE